MIVEFVIFLIGAVITALLALLEGTGAIDIGWFWVFVPLIVVCGIIILPLDVDCG